MAALGTVLLVTWFITSSDSGTLLVTTVLSMGSDDPPKRFRIVCAWAGASLPQRFC